MSIQDKIKELYHGYPDASFEFKDGYEVAKNHALGVIKDNDVQYQMCKVIQDRLDDALENLSRVPIGHPVESQKITYMESLKDLKKDLKRSGLWIII